MSCVCDVVFSQDTCVYSPNFAYTFLEGTQIPINSTNFNSQTIIDKFYRPNEQYTMQPLIWWIFAARQSFSRCLIGIPCKWFLLICKETHSNPLMWWGYKILSTLHYFSCFGVFLKNQIIGLHSNNSWLIHRYVSESIYYSLKFFFTSDVRFDHSVTFDLGYFNCPRVPKIHATTRFQ